MSVVGGTALAEARELYSLLSECMQLLDKVETKAKRSRNEIAMLLTAASAVMGVLRRMDLGEEHDEIVAKIQRIVTMLIVLRTQLMVTYAAMGPLGWVIAGLGVVGMAFTLEDMMYTLAS